MVEAVAQELQTRDEALQQLRYHLSKAQDAMVKQANRKRRPVTIKVDDWVFLKIRPHRQTSMSVKLHPKLTARYYGPFKVLQKIREVAFRLELPTTARIHPVFHVSQLKLAIGTKQVEAELPANLQVGGYTCWPTKVLNKSVQQQEGEQCEQVLIEWQDGGAAVQRGRIGD
ncbi:hypothetical protein VIGAN_10000300 [Vigna angularis var. angularis]|uniref:Tf2-1-like SH3-like domain-containing protein n=1 Tax=Vigna angularis var. angularis TaxID=157739 RepID=A0A0S3T0G6_PHAAN|nr:hypothetical protein VIGAN_10000300 [Vigna angularis var. angularis]